MRDVMKMNKIFRNFNDTKLLWGLFSIMLMIIFFNSLKRYIYLDEIEAIHSSWKILQGEKIYIGFFQHHHFLFYYLIAPMILIFKETTATIIAMRVLMFFTLILIFAATYFISVKTFGKKTGIISLILLSSAIIFVNRAIEIRPDLPQVLFGLLSVLFLLGYFENNSQKNLLLSSFFSGLSFIFHLKSIFLILLIIILLLRDVLRKHKAYRDLLTYILVFTITVMPLYIYIFFANSLSSYIMFNCIMNSKLLSHVMPLWLIRETIHENGIFWLFWALGSLFFLKTANQRRIGFFSLGLLLAVFLKRVAWFHDFLIAIPFAATISAYAINSLFNRNKNMLIVVLVVSILFPAYVFTHYNLVKFNNDEGLKTINYILSLTDSKDFVYDGQRGFNVFRKDLDFFWFGLGPNDLMDTYRYLTNYHYDIYELIEKYKPKIISNAFIEHMDDKRISSHYVQTNRYKDLYIRIDAE